MSNHGDFSDQGRVASSLVSMAANDELHDGSRPRSPAEVLEPARAPEPPKGHRRKRTHPIFVLMNAMMSLLVVALLALGGLLYFAKDQFDKQGPLGHSTVFVIPRGEGVNAIAERLERDGIIHDRRIFVASVIYFKVQERLKAGEYEILKNSSMRDVLDKLVEGRAVLHKVSIPEGLTSEQIVGRLNAHKMLKGEITEIPAEGSLLPDTYKFSRGMTRQDLIERMKAEQRKFIERLWEKRQPNLPVKTQREAIILASIVEKETGRADERSRVAGVFINRLRKGIPLQSDPTIIYGIVGGKGTLGRGILKSELVKKTPYNTYKIKGLTPTPIANPGRAAIEAVLNPAKTNDLYFVANGTGGHAFAPSLAKHNSNVAEWRKIERIRREKEQAKAKAKAAAARAVAGLPPQDATPLASAVPGQAESEVSVPESGLLSQPVISGLTSAETAPGGVSESIIEGLSITFRPPMAAFPFQQSRLWPLRRRPLQAARLPCRHQNASQHHSARSLRAIPNRRSSCLAGPTGLKVSLEMTRVAIELIKAEGHSGARGWRGTLNVA